ncbi:hypothetical protein [Nocardia spumae]|uniref:hypothetical protein n=1 Tax=Nocardia spumae TaxID=2887190 RepID=UPI001D15604A|nr:hypothetical protein [Nocardia spumae]
MSKDIVSALIGVTVAGERDTLGLWVGDCGEGAKYWLVEAIDERGTATNDYVKIYRE